MSLPMYPYTNMSDTNLDWVISTVKKLEQELADVQKKWTEESKKYTDEQIAILRQDIANLESDINAFKLEIQASQNTFEQTIINRILTIEFSFNQFKERVNDEVKSAYDYTNQAIDYNNAYLINELSKAARNLTVINYFTGLETTIQDMFNYLAQFHTENAITYNQLALRDKSVNDIISLDITYTDLALNGGSLIV